MTLPTLPQGYEEEADEYASLGYILWYDEESEYIPYHHPYRVTDKNDYEIAFFDSLEEAKLWRENH